MSTVRRSHRDRLVLVAALSAVLVATDAVLLRQWVESDPSPFTGFTDPLLTDVVLGVAAVGYLLLRLPPVQAWTCLLVLALDVGADLQLDQFGGGAWFVAGGLIAALAVPALLALVLRYPWHGSRPRRGSGWAWPPSWACPPPP